MIPVTKPKLCYTQMCVPRRETAWISHNVFAHLVRWEAFEEIPEMVVVQAMEGQALPTLVEGEALPLKEVELHQVTSSQLYIVLSFAVIRINTRGIKGDMYALVIRINTRGSQSCHVSCCHYKT